MEDQSIDDTDALDLMYSNEEKGPPRPQSKDVLQDDSKALGFKGTAVGSLASDNNEWMRFAAKNLYPNEPVEQSIQRFGQTKEGDYYHKADDGKMYRVDPKGFIPRLGSALGPSITAIHAGVGSAAGTLVGGPVGAGVVGFGASGIGEYQRQKLGDVLMPEASTHDLNWPKLMTDAVIGATTEFGGRALMGAYNLKTAPDIARLNSPRTQAAYDRADKYDVPITPAQASGLRSLAEKQRSLANYPSTADKMEEFTKVQNEKAKGAFNKFLTENFGPQRDASRLSEDVENLSERFIKNQQNTRSEIVEPYFKLAENSVGPVDTSNILKSIDEKLPYEVGDAKKALLDVREELLRDTQKGLPPQPEDRFRKLSNLKMHIDKLIDDPEFAIRRGIDSADAKTNGILVELKNAIKGSINEADPNKSYAKGLKVFEEFTEGAVTPTREALAPLLKRNAELGTMMINSARSILNPETRSPELVKSARDMFVKNGQIDAWNALIGQLLRQRAVAASRLTRYGDMSNFGGKISHGFSDEFLDDNLKAAMHPSQYAAFKDINELFRDIGKTSDINSSTAYRMDAIQQEKREVGTWAMIARGFQPWNLPKKAEEMFAEIFRQKQNQILADLYTKNDRTVINKLRSLKTYSNRDKTKNSMLLQGAVRILQNAGYLTDYIQDVALEMNNSSSGEQPKQ